MPIFNNGDDEFIFVRRKADVVRAGKGDDTVVLQTRQDLTAYGGRGYDVFELMNVPRKAYVKFEFDGDNHQTLEVIKHGKVLQTIDLYGFEEVHIHHVDEGPFFHI